MFKRHHHLLMSALGIALSAGGTAVASAFDAVEKFVVTGALKVTHTITEQVCEFSTVDQLEAYLENVADRHNWFRHDQPAAAPLTDIVGTTSDVDQLAAPMTLAAIVGETTVADQIDTTAAQVDTLAKPADAIAGPAPAAIEADFSDKIAENAALEAQVKDLMSAATDASAPVVDGTVTATDSTTA